NGEMVRNAFSIGPEDTMVACQCMAHNFVFAQQVFPVLSAGGSVFVVEFGDVGGTIAALRQDATMIMLIPWFAYRLFEALRAHPLDLPALRMCFVGGDRIDPSLLELGRAATGIPISQNIGMTETNSFAADIGGAPWSKPGSLGRPLPGAEVEIRDDRGKPVSTGTSGQIWVRSPGNMAGYWNNPEATEATLVDGWVATGDAGHFDEDGLLWFDGRIKHIIIHDGDNIYPAEVERAILRHPGVDAVTVFGLPHPRHGEVVAAAIAGSRPTLPEAAALRAFLKEHLSAAKIPCHWLRLRQIPLNRNGKPNIPAIRDALAAQPGFRVGM
ncbi:MAG: fatty acid--CoA ligase family protein, partial [Xanthomonadales bacterium]|nr:fatty acid--CoA ligase family protein [Xanthomonadales bacterium]